jgi:Uma2 family endonuclease
MATALKLNLPPALKLTDEQFEKLAIANRDARLELTAQGDLVIMPPTDGETGNRNFELYLDLGNWNRQTRLGKAFDSSTGFQLPNGAKRSPDMSWISLEKWESLSKEQRKKFLPLCPDFAVELVSESDDLDDTRQKMREYLDNGLRLGWLVVPSLKLVEIYRCDREVECLQSPSNLSGEDILPGLVVDLQPIWEL